MEKEIFPWSDRFNTGLTIIDEQHKQLVVLINHLANLLTFKSSKKRQQEAMTALRDYMILHCETEESLWQEFFIGEDDVIRHSEDHQYFLDELDRLIAEQKNKLTDIVIEKTISHFIKWFFTHILESDRLLAYQIQNVREGVSIKESRRKAYEMMREHSEEKQEIIISFYETLSNKSLKLMKAINIQSQYYLDIVETIVLSLDCDGLITMINRKGCELLEYSQDELLGQSWFDKCLPKHNGKEDANAIFKKIIAGEISGTKYYENLVQTKSGSQLLIAWNTSCLWDEAGTITGTLSSGTDITEKIIAEDELRMSKERLEEAQNIGHIGSWELNLVSNKLHWSKETYNIFGTDPEMFNVSYKSFINSVHPDDVGMVELAYEKSAKTGKDYDVVHRIIRKDDGEIRYVHERARVIGDSKGQAIRTIGTVQDVTSIMLADIENQNHTEKLNNSLKQTIQAIAFMVEIRDPYTAGHQRRVAYLAAAIANKMGLDEDMLEGLLLGGMIHDLGKMSIPAEILTKPGSLSDIEYDIIKTHSTTGYEITKGIEFPWPVAGAILQHHERVNGSGYPSGLIGDEIMLEAKILAVADVVEAISSYRPYRSSKGIDNALTEIENNKGILYDETVVDSCLQLFASGYKLADK